MCVHMQCTRLPQLMALELSGNQLTRIDDNIKVGSLFPWLQQPT